MVCVGVIMRVSVVRVRARGVRITVGRPLGIPDGIVWIGPRLASGVVLSVVRVRVAGVGVQGSNGGGATGNGGGHGGAVDRRDGQRGGVGEGGNRRRARPAVRVVV